MRKKIRNHLWLLSLQIMELEHSVCIGKITREEAVKELDRKVDIFTDYIYWDFKEIGREISMIFEGE